LTDSELKNSLSSGVEKSMMWIGTKTAKWFQNQVYVAVPPWEY